MSNPEPARQIHRTFQTSCSTSRIRVLCVPQSTAAAVGSPSERDTPEDQIQLASATPELEGAEAP